MCLIESLKEQFSEDDEVLYDENYKVLEENKMKGISVFVVTMKTPKPQISNIEVVLHSGKNR